MCDDLNPTLAILKTSPNPKNVSNRHHSDEMVQLKLRAFRSQLNPHFIFNSLSAIQYFITTENKRLAVIYLSVFSKLIRFYLKHMEQESVNLADEIEMLKAYFSLQKLRYNEQFSYEILQDETTSPSEAIIPSFILQTLFENIIEHAIYNQYREYSIVIKFKVSEQNVIVHTDFNYLAGRISKAGYTPEYRAKIMLWQDQIRLLNQLRNYKIKKRVSFFKNSILNGGNIVVTLPNLQ